MASDWEDLESATAAYRSAQTALDAAKEQVKANQAHLKVVRRELAATVVAAAKSGTRVRDLREITGLSREWIRQILRAAGVDPD